MSICHPICFLYILCRSNTAETAFITLSQKYGFVVLYCIVLYLLPVLNPKSYDGTRVLEASGRPIVVLYGPYYPYISYVSPVRLLNIFNPSGQLLNLLMLIAIRAHTHIHTDIFSG